MDDEINAWRKAWTEKHGEPMRLRVDPTTKDLLRWEEGVYQNLCVTPMDWHSTIAGESHWFIRPDRARDLHWALVAETPRLRDEDRHDLLHEEPWINFRNGVLDLRTGTLRPHGEEWTTTYQVPWDYTDQEIIERDTEALDWFLKKATDQETAEVLWRIFGYALAGGNPDQALVILYGPAGSGKGTISSVLRTMLGPEGYASLTLAKMGGRFTSHLLYGKPVNIAGDVAGGTIPRYEDLLSLTGGDPIHGDRKGREGIDFTWRGLLLLSTNDVLSLPRGVSSRTGWWRRAHYIEVDHPPLAEGERVNSRVLMDRLLPNPAAAASRAVRSISEAVQSNDGRLIVPSRAMVAASGKARLTGDAVADWATSRLDRAEGRSVEGSDAWRDFGLWAATNGAKYPHGARRFYSDLEAVMKREGLGHRDNTRTETSRCRFVGVTLAPEQEIFRPNVLTYRN